MPSNFFCSVSSAYNQFPDFASFGQYTTTFPPSAQNNGNITGLNPSPVSESTDLKLLQLNNRLPNFPVNLNNNDKQRTMNSLDYAGPAGDFDNRPEERMVQNSSGDRPTGSVLTADQIVKQDEIDKVKSNMAEIERLVAENPKLGNFMDMMDIKPSHIVAHHEIISGEYSSLLSGVR